MKVAGNRLAHQRTEQIFRINQRDLTSTLIGLFRLRKRTIAIWNVSSVFHPSALVLVDREQCAHAFHWRKTFSLQRKIPNLWKREMLVLSTGIMTIRRVAHQIVRYVAHCRRLLLENVCWHIHTRSFNMDFERCGTVSLTFLEGKVDIGDDGILTSNLSITIESIRSLANGEGHSLRGYFHWRTFLYNPSPNKMRENFSRWISEH